MSGLVIYNHLVGVWCAGLTKDGQKVKYTVDRYEAVLYANYYQAKKVFDRLPYVWKPHHEIMEYMDSVKAHDKYFNNPSSSTPERKKSKTDSIFTMRNERKM